MAGDQTLGNSGEYTQGPETPGNADVYGGGGSTGDKVASLIDEHGIPENLHHILDDLMAAGAGNLSTMSRSDLIAALNRINNGLDGAPEEPEEKTQTTDPPVTFRPDQAREGDDLIEEMLDGDGPHEFSSKMRCAFNMAAGALTGAAYNTDADVGTQEAPEPSPETRGEALERIAKTVHGPVSREEIGLIADTSGVPAEALIAKLKKLECSRVNGIEVVEAPKPGEPGVTHTAAVTNVPQPAAPEVSTLRPGPTGMG